MFRCDISDVTNDEDIFILKDTYVCQNSKKVWFITTYDNTVRNYLHNLPILSQVEDLTDCYGHMTAFQIKTYKPSIKWQQTKK